VIKVTTVYGQPLLGLCWALFVGWLWSRDKVLQEIKQGYPDLEKGLFWKIWPWYVRVVCPILMLMVFFA
jgi:NSS family neurotransmitter:Na+ symporter